MKLYVGNLSFAATESELTEAFAQYGAVNEVNIITDRETGRSRGFAFVSMSDSGAAKEAMSALDGTDLGGRTIKVSEAKERARN